jgi:hypothetical protein
MTTVADMIEQLKKLPQNALLCDAQGYEVTAASAYEMWYYCGQFRNDACDKHGEKKVKVVTLK